MLRAPLEPHQDAFGQLLRDRLDGIDAIEVVERDDGDVFAGRSDYWLAPFRSWWPQERRAMRFVRGRVLDVGCGAGRVGMHLQARGHEVVGVELSPLVAEIARERGLADVRVGRVERAVRQGERFDTILLLGNNIGLLGGERSGRLLLRRLAGMAADDGRLLAGSFDPYEGASELKLAYQRRNRERGRMGGVERIRVRYGPYATPWYDVLFASRDELRALIEGTGWAVGRFVDEEAGYVAVLERVRASRGRRPRS